MKKILSFFTIMLATLAGYSQAPGILNYQGVARNSVGNVLVNKTINLRLTIRDGSASGPTVYQESRVVTTNPFGLFNVQVGSPGATSVTGTISGVNWAVGAKFIQVEIDPNGGTSFINIGTAQLASVPYSLYSNLSGDLVLPFNKTQADAGTLFKITNSNTASAGATALEGLTNSTAGNASAIIGTVTSASPGGFSAGVRGINNGTAGLGIGVYGSQAGSGWGVYGFTPAGIGVNGASTTGTGVFGSSSTGNAGIFSITNASNNSDALVASTNGGASSWALRATSTGAQGAGIFVYNNATGSANALRVMNNGSGASVSALASGNGNAGFFQINNASSNASAVVVNTNTTAAPALSVSGPNIWGSAIGITNNTSGMEWRMSVQGTTWQVTKVTGSTFTPFRLSQNGDVEFPSTAGTQRVTILDNGNLGIGTATPATRLHVAGQVRIVDGTEGANRVFVSDASGTGSWQPLAVIGGVSGSGTLNYIPKWTPNGTTLGNSLMFDNGSSIGISTTTPLRKLDIVQTGSTYTGVNIVHSVVPSLNLTATGAVGGREIISFGEPVASPAGPVNAQIGFFKTGESIHQNNLVFATDNFGSRPDITISKTNNGNVGIGRSDATAKMEIFSNSVVGTPQLLINEDDNDFARINFRTTAPANSGNNFWAVAGYNNNTRGNERLNFYNNATGNLMSIGGTGKVGLDNTTFSTAKFTVFSNDGTRGFPAIRIQNAFSGQGDFDGIYMGYNFTNTGDAYNVNQANGDYVYGTNNDLTQLVLKSNGYIGAGTTNPIARLHVVGGSASATITPTWVSFEPNSYFSNTTADATNKVGGLGFADNSTIRNLGLLGIAGGSGLVNYGVAGLAGETSAGSNIGVFAQAQNSTLDNYGIVATCPIGPNNWAGFFRGRVAIQDGTQANGRVLTSDASGNASWQENTSQSIGISARQFTVSNTIPHATLFPLTNWATIMNEDGGANYNPATGEYTITKDGTYQINASVLWDPTPSGGPGVRAVLLIYINGSFEYETSTAITQNAYVSNVIAWSKKLSAGDIISFRVFQDSGNNMTLPGVFYGQHFSIQYLHK